MPKISPVHWAGRQNKWVKESHPSSFEINSLLQKKLSDLDSFIIRNHLIGRPIDFNSIEEFYFKQGDVSIFNDFAKDYVKNVRGLALNTLKVYNTFLKHLDSFNKRIKFSDLNEGLLQSFKEFLQFDQGLKGGATKKYFDKLKVICKEAVKKGFLEVNQNPFYYSDIRVKVDKPKRTHLEIEEIMKIASLDLDGALERHRDHFLFQICTGLYYRDFKNLISDDIQENSLGPYIIGNRIKNENQFIIPVYKFPMAVRILNKYRIENSYIVFSDTISDQKYNEHLKTIAEKAEIRKTLTNKVARHTYVQLWMSRGTERQFVSRLVGHTEEDTTQEYYNLSIHDVEKKLSTVKFEEFK